MKKTTRIILAIIMANILSSIFALKYPDFPEPLASQILFIAANEVLKED